MGKSTQTATWDNKNSALYCALQNVGKVRIVRLHRPNDPRANRFGNVFVIHYVTQKGFHQNNGGIGPLNFGEEK